MLKSLNISNIVLIDKTNISFKKGFNVISGETGSGKSVVMEAITQVLGGRVNSNIVRLGASKGVIVATFDIENIDDLKELFHASGIDHEPADDLIIKKEISANGKNRSFVNNQQVSATVLKKIGANLFQIVSQHAKSMLFDPAKHLEVLDFFGGLEKEKKSFSALFDQEKKLKRELDDLQNSDQARLEEIKTLQKEFKELDEAKIKEGEEEELFLQYSKISNVEEIKKLSNEIKRAFSGDKGVINTLNQQLRNFDDLAALDPSVDDNFKAFQSTKLEFEEVLYSLQSYSSRLEYDPGHFEVINDRLQTINTIKKKYGPTTEDVFRYIESLLEKLSHLDGSEFIIEELQKKHEQVKDQLDSEAANLSEKRNAVVKKFAATITKELQSLNMKKAIFSIEHTNKERSRHGDDHIEFYFCPNVGEKNVPIKECASGGELSRIMMAIKATLSSKEKIPSIIFDEIDANVGGKTATIMGEKLKSIGDNQQVLCITHFPQVAALSHHHIKISKKEVDGRTVTHIETLDDNLKELELSRMMGK